MFSILYQQMYFVLFVLVFLQYSAVGAIKTTQNYWTLKPNGLFILKHVHDFV